MTTKEDVKPISAKDSLKKVGDTIFVSNALIRSAISKEDPIVLDDLDEKMLLAARWTMDGYIIERVG